MCLVVVQCDDAACECGEAYAQQLCTHMRTVNRAKREPAHAHNIYIMSDVGVACDAGGGNVVRMWCTIQ